MWKACDIKDNAESSACNGYTFYSIRSPAIIPLKRTFLNFCFHQSRIRAQPEYILVKELPPLVFIAIHSNITAQ